MTNITLIMTGSIAVCESLQLIRLCKAQHITVTPVMTKAAKEFITPMTVSSLTQSKVYDDLFDVESEQQMGHISLSRISDMIVVAPATADIIAKAANGLADDLASTLLLASDKPIMMAPAMNVKMWENKAVQRNIAQLKKDGVMFIGPEEGKLACGEVGMGRMSPADKILQNILSFK